MRDSTVQYSHQQCYSMQYNGKPRNTTHQKYNDTQHKRKIKLNQMDKKRNVTSSLETLSNIFHKNRHADLHHGAIVSKTKMSLCVHLCIGWIIHASTQSIVRMVFVFVCCFKYKSAEIRYRCRLSFLQFFGFCSDTLFISFILRFLS